MNRSNRNSHPKHSQQMTGPNFPVPLAFFVSSIFLVFPTTPTTSPRPPAFVRDLELGLGQHLLKRLAQEGWDGFDWKEFLKETVIFGDETICKVVWQVFFFGGLIQFLNITSLGRCLMVSLVFQPPGLFPVDVMYSKPVIKWVAKLLLYPKHFKHKTSGKLWVGLFGVKKKHAWVIRVAKLSYQIITDPHGFTVQKPFGRPRPKPCST